MNARAMPRRRYLRLRWALFLGLAPCAAFAVAEPATPIAALPVLPALPAIASEPTSFLTHAFGHPAEIKVVGVKAEDSEALFLKVVAEISELEKLADPTHKEGEIARLNEGVQDPARPLDVRLVRLLERAAAFCAWSEGAHGPLGGELYALWGLRQPPAPAPMSPPAADRLRQAAATASCAGLAVDPLKATVRLTPGARIETWGFREGLAVDRVAEVLQAAGSTSFLVQIGTLWRASGSGPEGKGWTVELPMLPGQQERAGRIFLKDSALALVVDPQRIPSHQGKGFAGYLNQRTGRAPEGTLAAAAITTVGIDAQGLAVSLFLLGPREGQLRMGSLAPKPSASWWMGSGEGPPVQVNYRWSEAMRP